MARARRLRKAWSSSTISKVFSPCAGGASGELAVGCMTLHLVGHSQTLRNVSSAGSRGKRRALHAVPRAVLLAHADDLEELARPGHGQHGSALGRVGGGERRAGAFEQRFGDEQAESEP